MRSEEVLQDSDIKKALEAIPPVKKRLRTHPSLPFPFIPASDERFQEPYYWDTYFILVGLANTEGNQAIIKGIIEDFFFVLDKYGHIPNAFFSYNTRSQPPVLSAMVGLVRRPKIPWLKRAYQKVAKEYEQVWTAKPRLTGCGLSRYFNDDAKNHLWEQKEFSKMEAEGWKMDDYGAIQESGWDMTTRFQKRAHLTCPVDLNALLYRYETDLQLLAHRIGKDTVQWRKRAERRRKLMGELMWNEDEGLFFDYDFQAKEQLNTKTLAAYFPLWAKLATKDQASKLRENLPLFERDFGLACTEESLSHVACQWSYPNGWPPLHWIVIQGLRNYGFHDDADRITEKWLKRCAAKVLHQGQWPEKDTVVKDMPTHHDPRYPHQRNQAWTISVFQALYEDLSSR